MEALMKCWKNWQRDLCIEYCFELHGVVKLGWNT